MIDLIELTIQTGQNHHPTSIFYLVNAFVNRELRRVPDKILLLDTVNVYFAMFQGQRHVGPVHD